VRLNWNAMIGALALNGRLHLGGAVPEPLPVDAFSLAIQQRCVSGSPGASPAMIAKNSTSRHGTMSRRKPSNFPMNYLNEAFVRLGCGKARCCVVMDSHF
jgi:alcohol/geraniol dehydrogenase (NADP+)